MLATTTGDTLVNQSIYHARTPMFQVMVGGVAPCRVTMHGNEIGTAQAVPISFLDGTIPWEPGYFATVPVIWGEVLALGKSTLTCELALTLIC
jgi:hypothetical protein